MAKHIYDREGNYKGKILSDEEHKTESEYERSIKCYICNSAAYYTYKGYDICILCRDKPKHYKDKHIQISKSLSKRTIIFSIIILLIGFMTKKWEGWGNDWMVVVVIVLWIFTCLIPSKNIGNTTTKPVKKIKRKTYKDIKFAKASECIKIIKPKISDNGIVTFYDLEGKRVTKIPSKKRDISVYYKCYLGLKKFKNSERWVPIKKSDITDFKTID